jgi:hypothetical protein
LGWLLLAIVGVALLSIIFVSFFRHHGAQLIHPGR